MPLDTSTYSLAHLRLDGRRWNELRRFNASLSTQASADGSSYLESGNTKVLCTVTGPSEQRRAGASTQRDSARIDAEISIAGFSGINRQKRSGRTDRKTMEMAHCIEECFGGVVLGHLYPHSVISINVSVLSQDGGVLAACLNAAGLALVDAGVPMVGFVGAVSVGITGGGGGSGSGGSVEDDDDPVLDLNGLEENELPFLTMATVGGGGGEAEEGDKVNVLIMETRMQMAKLDSMLAVGVEGCRRVRGLLDVAVRMHGKRVLEGRVG